MHLWSSDFKGGEPEEGFSAEAPGPAGSGDAGWEISFEPSSGATKVSKARWPGLCIASPTVLCMVPASASPAVRRPPAQSNGTGATSASMPSFSSMAPQGEIPTVVPPLTGPCFAALTPFSGPECELDEAALAASLDFMKKLVPTSPIRAQTPPLARRSARVHAGRGERDRRGDDRRVLVAHLPRARARTSAARRQPASPPARPQPRPARRGAAPGRRTL